MKIKILKRLTSLTTRIMRIQQIYLNPYGEKQRNDKQLAAYMQCCELYFKKENNKFIIEYVESKLNEKTI